MLVAVGCAPSATRGGFDSPNPAARLYAIHRAGQTRDRSAVPQLVTCLESDDPAMRMLAIQALQRIVGQRLGYSPYGTPAERQAAIAAWTALVNTPPVDPRSIASAPPATQPVADAGGLSGNAP